jgi:DNA repair exonuclease SbcCD nuclease subunit
MKRMIFSDVHLHPWKYGATTLENGYNSRLWAQFEALGQVVQTCIEEEIEYAYFAGDMFHTPGNVPTQALSLYVRFENTMMRRGIRLRMLVGNHDMGNRAGNIHALDLDAVKPGETKTWEDDGLLVHGLGYTTDEDVLRKFLEYGAERGGMLLMHQGVAGVPLASGYILDEKLSHDLIPDNCVAFTGHYHIHSPVSERLTVIGNLTALNWNDVDQRKGFIIYDDDTGQMEQRSAGAPEFVTYLDGTTKIEGNFVRYAGPVDPYELGKIRGDMLEAGALEVEFSNVVDSNDGHQYNTSEAGPENFNPTTYITELEKEMDPRRVEVGQQTREQNYA